MAINPEAAPIHQAAEEGEATREVEAASVGRVVLTSEVEEAEADSVEAAPLAVFHQEDLPDVEEQAAGDRLREVCGVDQERAGFPREVSEVVLEVAVYRKEARRPEVAAVVCPEVGLRGSQEAVCEAVAPQAED